MAENRFLCNYIRRWWKMPMAPRSFGGNRLVEEGCQEPAQMIWYTGGKIRFPILLCHGHAIYRMHTITGERWTKTPERYRFVSIDEWVAQCMECELTGWLNEMTQDIWEFRNNSR